MKNSEFQYDLFRGLLHDCCNFQDNSADFLRFGIRGSDRIKRRLQDCILLLAKRIGFFRRHFAIQGAAEHLMGIMRNIDKLEAKAAAK